MSFFPPQIDRLISEFSKLPGVGRKSATRLAFHVLEWNEAAVEEFADAMIDAKRETCLCKTCFNLSASEVCEVCSSDSRDRGVVCVVAEPRDMAAVERTREFKGVYHVLHGVISPGSSKSPDDLRIRELVDRVSGGGVREVILATNPDTEGDTTALYIARLLRPFEVLTTRLAHGIPMGGHLEFADEVTLMRAIEGRRTL